MRCSRFMVFSLNGFGSGLQLRGRPEVIRSNAGLEFPIYPHMLRHAMGYYLANNGVDTRTMQAAATAAQGRLRPLFHLNCSQAQRSLIANASVSVRPGAAVSGAHSSLRRKA